MGQTFWTDSDSGTGCESRTGNIRILVAGNCLESDEPDNKTDKRILHMRALVSKILVVSVCVCPTGWVKRGTEGPSSQMSGCV